VSGGGGGGQIGGGWGGVTLEYDSRAVPIQKEYEQALEASGSWASTNPIRISVLGGWFCHVCKMEEGALGPNACAISPCLAGLGVSSWTSTDTSYFVEVGDDIDTSCALLAQR